jgi:hypothetical protein
MILGMNRLPFQTPAAATPGFIPSNPHTGFFSHINPFIQVMRRMGSMHNAYRPPGQSQMGPQMLPNVPLPAPTTAPVPAAGGMAGAFGSTGGTKMHSHVSPYRTMHSGYMAPGTYPSGSNIRSGVNNAWARVNASMPFQTAPLPEPPPPPPPMPVATHGFGMHRGGRPRRHRWWHLNPPSTQEQMVAANTGCETYPPNMDGLRITVCDGRVTRVEDAQGNVRTPHSPDFAGGGLGWPSFRRFAQYADPRWGVRHGLRHLNPRNVDPRYAARHAF